MRCTGRVVDTSRDWQTGKFKLTFEINEDVSEQITEICEIEKLSIKAEKYREKRSLAANNYCWKLCDKIADKLKTTKEDIYRKAIKNVGVFDDFTGRTEAVQNLVKAWENYGTGWFTEIVDIVGETPTLRLYYGSSSYDSKQMARLIDELIEFCKDAGVEYLPPEEVERMLTAWQNS